MSALLQRRWMRIVLIVIGVSFILSTSAAIYIYAYGQADHAQKADVIIVLGAGVERDGTATWATHRRVMHGAALYKQGFAPYILCTGGFESYPEKSEASVCKDILQQSAVPDSAILMEENSSSTEENAIEAHKVMQEKGFKTAILVTDNFHMLRSEMLFHRQGLTIFTSPAQITSGTLELHFAVFFTYREVAALFWFVVKTALGLPYTHSPF